MRRLIALSMLVSLIASNAAPASSIERPSKQTITIIDQAGISPDRLQLIERAIVAQSLQLRRVWKTPVVRFGPNGWPLYIIHLGNFYAGIHSGGHGSSPRIYINLDDIRHIGLELSIVISHEVMETLVDPYLRHTTTHLKLLVEVCDPVWRKAYRLKGVSVSDFVFPAFYYSHRGPYDQMGVRHHGTPWRNR